jgi:hypothetical protein
MRMTRYFCQKEKNGNNDGGGSDDAAGPNATDVI